MRSCTPVPGHNPIVAGNLALRSWGRDILQSVLQYIQTSGFFSTSDLTLGRATPTVGMILGLWCLLGLGALAESAAPDVPIVNLYRGEINSTQFATMTVDTLQSLLGPPSATEAPEHPEEEDTQIQYHALGLSFGMRRPDAHAPVQCWRVHIYLTQTWDARAGTFFLPFSGRISKQVTRAWTPQQIAAEFRQWSPYSIPQAQDAARGQDVQHTPAAHTTSRVLMLDMGDFQLAFVYAHPEQRLHAIHLTRPLTRHSETR